MNMAQCNEVWFPRTFEFGLYMLTSVTGVSFPNINVQTFLSMVLLELIVLVG